MYQNRTIVRFSKRLNSGYVVYDQKVSFPDKASALRWIDQVSRIEHIFHARIVSHNETPDGPDGIRCHLCGDDLESPTHEGYLLANKGTEYEGTCYTVSDEDMPQDETIRRMRQALEEIVAEWDNDHPSQDDTFGIWLAREILTPSRDETPGSCVDDDSYWDEQPAAYDREACLDLMYDAEPPTFDASA